MPERVLIQKEEIGFTLHVIGRERMGADNCVRLEVENDLTNEGQALELLSCHYKLTNPPLIEIEDFEGDILLEGIDVLTVKKSNGIYEFNLKDFFAEAIEIMLKEANEQELANQFLPVLNQGGFAKEAFCNFFYLQLKQTREKPDCYIYPEFSSINPLIVESAFIGRANERQWGIIRDKDNLEAITSSIHEAIFKKMGSIPPYISANNYYLKLLTD